MMSEKGLQSSTELASEDKIDRLFPMLFSLSCVFFALKQLPEPESCDQKWLEIRDRMLKGSAHLLGLIVWCVQREEFGKRNGNSELVRKLTVAEAQIVELKKRRSEDARANERVVCIFAAREQTWLDERRKLRQQIGSLMNDLRVLETKNMKSLSELNDKLKKTEAMLELKDKAVEEAEQGKKDMEEKLQNMEIVVNEMKENLKNETQRRLSEISKHKTAFIELVSNQRQLEAEMGRALRQVDAAKQELDSALVQREQSFMMAQRLSADLVNISRDLEQKDHILSVMLRKSKMDTGEKQMLLNEVKTSKAKRKQAEVEIARWKAFSESKQERQSLKSILAQHFNVKSDVLSNRKGLFSRSARSLDVENLGSMKRDYYIEYEKPEIKKGLGVLSLASEPYFNDETDEPGLVTGDENYVISDAETHNTAIEQRHNFELNVFTEQLRVKDEKLEAFQWHLMRMDMESQRLKSHIEGLDHDITQLRQENMKLEALLMNREAELNSLKEQLVMQFNPPNLQKLNLNSSTNDESSGHGTVWSKVKIIKRKPGQKMQEINTTPKEILHEKIHKIPDSAKHKDIVLTLKPPLNEKQETKCYALSSPNHLRKESVGDGSESSANTEMSLILGQGQGKASSNSTWRMDIHALGVSYKIKRLKQQLLMLERLTGKKESSEQSEKNEHFGVKGFYALVSLLNKQVDRYNSLQEKIDDICKRMHEKNLNLSCERSTITRSEDETKHLEHFLEETFQLQRYIVATGQKLLEVQTKIASAFINGDAEEIEKPDSFDIKRFADNIRILLREVQRGLEVRLSRIIGDLEGTLAFEGMIHLKR